MVMAERQAHISMEQNWKPRNKPRHMWTIYNKEAKNRQQRKDSLFDKQCGENRHAQKEKTAPQSHTMQKNELKMDYRQM